MQPFPRTPIPSAILCQTSVILCQTGRRNTCGWAAWGERLTLRELLPRFDLATLRREPAVLTPQVKAAMEIQD